MDGECKLANLSILDCKVYKQCWYCLESHVDKRGKAVHQRGSPAEQRLVLNQQPKLMTLEDDILNTYRERQMRWKSHLHDQPHTVPPDGPIAGAQWSPDVEAYDRNRPMYPRHFSEEEKQVKLAASKTSGFLPAWCGSGTWAKYLLSIFSWKLSQNVKAILESAYQMNTILLQVSRLTFRPLGEPAVLIRFGFASGPGSSRFTVERGHWTDHQRWRKGFWDSPWSLSPQGTNRDWRDWGKLSSKEVLLPVWSNASFCTVLTTV